MSADLLIPCLFGAMFLLEFVHLYLQRYYSWKCGYDCSRCRVWDCPARECKRRRGNGGSQ